MSAAAAPVRDDTTRRAPAGHGTTRSPHAWRSEISSTPAPAAGSSVRRAAPADARRSRDVAPTGSAVIAPTAATLGPDETRFRLSRRMSRTSDPKWSNGPAAIDNPGDRASSYLDMTYYLRRRDR